MSRTDPGGLSRDRLVTVALELLHEQGLDGLSMRALAERLQVKAASLYWHVRDRGELLELLADAFLARLPAPAARKPWPEAARDLARAASAAAAAQRDAARLVLGTAGSLERSQAQGELSRLFEGAGLPAAEAGPAASMLLAYALLMPPAGGRPGRSGGQASIAIDSGSRGVTLRAGGAMPDLFRIPPDARTASPAVVRGDEVIVRRLRGGGRGEIELNPAYSWIVRVQGPTLNTILDLSGLDLREVKLDSGAVRVEIYLPLPRGKVRVLVSGGTGPVRIHRPPDTAVVAEVSSGALKVRLDAFSLAAAIGDSQWESRPRAAAGDHYQLLIGGGAVNVSLDAGAPVAPASRAGEPSVRDPAAAIEILLAGVAARLA